MKLFTLMLLIGVAFNSTSQKNLDNKGFYDSKFFVSVDAQANSPLIYNYRMGNNNYDYSILDKNLNEKKDRFNYGFRVSGNYLIKRNVAIGIETGFDFANVYPYKYSYIAGSEVIIQSEAMKIKTLVFMPKIELSTKNGLLPLGLSHQIGFGVAQTKIVKDNYANSYSFYDSPSIVYTATNNLFNYSSKGYKNYILMYAISMRTAITKNILINYGFRYTLNLAVSQSSADDANYIIKDSQLLNAVKAQRGLSLINFNLGLTYAF